MFESDLKTFQKKLNDEAKTGRNRIPTVHYFQDTEKFVLYFRNFEDLDIYSVVSFSKIIDFGEVIGTDPEKSLEDFRINYLFHATRILNNPSDLTKEERDKIVEEELDPLTKELEPGRDIIMKTFL